MESRICRSCGQRIVSPRRLKCECKECRLDIEHIEQCGHCGDLSHQPSHPQGREATEPDEASTDMPVLLTKQQAAAWAQVSVSKLDGWMDEPGFPAIRTPRHVRIHAVLFDHWLRRKALGEITDGA